MRRMSMSEVTTYSWSFDEDVHHYSRWGYSSLGVWRAKLEDFGEERGIQLLQDAGLSVSSLSWIGGFTGSEGVPHADSIADGLRAIRLAHELQAGCLIAHPGAQAGHTVNHARRLVCQALGRLMPLAEELNVVIGLEPMHPKCAGEWTFLTSAQDVMSLIREVASPHLKLVWDTYQLWDAAAQRQQVLAHVDQVALVQLSDARVPHSLDQDRCLLGAGFGDWDLTVREFHQAGYDGWWEVEIRGEEVTSANYDEVLEQCFAVVSELTPSLSQ